MEEEGVKGNYLRQVGVSHLCSEASYVLKSMFTSHAARDPEAYEKMVCDFPR